TTAATWKIKEIRVWERLFTTDPDKYRPKLADAIFTLLWNYRTGLDTSLAQALGQRGLREQEILAGLRPAGSTAPVDYEILAAHTPNEFWDWHDLTGALYNLALVHKKAGDLATGLQFMLRQVKVYERLAQVDPVNYQAALDQARADAAAFAP
ncbi:hypothetical protein ACFU5Y_25575, partial [Streptomyces gardneri]|uniref:hypothetical protein n=1 Tax=Streptomyces gardneri TaxID=66892 RepID=UPI0036AFC0ED